MEEEEMNISNLLKVGDRARVVNYSGVKMVFVGQKRKLLTEGITITRIKITKTVEGSPPEGHQMVLTWQVLEDLSDGVEFEVIPTPWPPDPPLASS